MANIERCVHYIQRTQRILTWSRYPVRKVALQKLALVLHL